MGVEYKKEYMDIAVKMAHEGIDGGCGGPFGCVIVQGDRIVARAHNTVVRDNDPTAHGEIQAIRAACKKLNTFDLTGCEIYTTGYPCPMCFCAILWSNIDKVYYGCNTSDTEIIGFRDKQFYDSIPAKMQEICHEVDRQECLSIYNTYNNMSDATNY